ncbi:histidinol-phosphate phosphatase family protein [Peribacillus deserti]|uniref:D,D-heptose 1,7-bisphosphate phosphatase n=1 Tax=Peribacillus deserti TaxID=673318 RepID=A0ABS2QE34_9BACI|nr:HAD-IIIA family hydrolase [Peribacillus deserti]MBM7691427.1 histidinol-phosphate phosphatase family protein [Peribacillus deserti]
MPGIIQAVFIDRDGTIGGSGNVVYPGEFRLFPSADTALLQLKKAGKLLFSFTNQPGISMGKASLEEFQKELTGFGFVQIYLCPHQHTYGCTCRKPSIGMLLQAVDENGLNLKQCVVIGDRWTDMVAAEQADCINILVKTGAGAEALKKYENKEFFALWGEVALDYAAADLLEAVEWLNSNYK